MISRASQDWRSQEILIEDQMPKLGNPFKAGRELTQEEAIEESENRILWLKQELFKEEKYLAAIQPVDETR